MRRLTTIIAVVLGLGSLALVGCATADSQEVSAQDFSRTQNMVHAAEQVGAQDVPRAERFLTYATSQLERAEAAADRGDHREARLLLTRARADADLAISVAQEGRLAQQVEQIDDRIERVRQQIPADQ
ncbi:MAG: DUF4398 domain-containing protein [Persicimonas sp.]